MKVTCTVWMRGKDRDNINVLPIHIRKFNITGTMVPGKHFMVDIRHKIDRMIAMIEEGDYFVIAKPRQYGKTTTLIFLSDALNKRGDYIAIPITFEDMGEGAFANEKEFAQTVCKLLNRAFQSRKEGKLAEYIEKEFSQIGSIFQLSEAVSGLCGLSSQKLVLLIDEVDKSSNYEVVISFLGMLRAKYLMRSRGTATFQSVILAGVHDVKSLKLKIRPDNKAQYVSPWNIAARFDISLEFSRDEIAQMLRDYVAEANLEMDVSLMAKWIAEYTSGYPFLVSAICKIMDEEILPVKEVKSLVYDDFVHAITTLLKEQNTNFESLIKNLENNPDIYLLMEKILLSGEKMPFVFTNTAINMGVTYGILKDNQGICAIHNLIYQELIYNHLESNIILESFRKGVLSYDIQENFLDKDGKLQMEMVLVKFQEFMKDNYSSQDQKFLEREGRLLFLAFLKPIINGYGHSFKEPVTSEEKRLDIVVTFLQNKYVIELKIWRGEEAHKRGLQQLFDYLHRQNLSNGYLLIYDFRKEKQYRQEEMVVEEKKIFVVWV